MQLKPIVPPGLTGWCVSPDAEVENSQVTLVVISRHYFLTLSWYQFLLFKEHRHMYVCDQLA